MRQLEMMTTLFAAAALTAGCGSPEIHSPIGLQGLEAPEVLIAEMSWTEPVHLDAPVNSPFRELGGAFSRDGLSLYFGSNRPGGQGALDIWVTRRACEACPWGEPSNLGPNINSAGGDGTGAFSPDGLLFFFSGGAREGGHGGEDIWVASRLDPNDDLGWISPVNLGPHINTADNEQSPTLYMRAVGDGDMELLFTRQGTGFHRARVTRGGEVSAPAVPVAELNDPTLADTDEMRLNGREVFLFQSTRLGGLGGSDIWVSARQTSRDEWVAPMNIGPTINTVGADLTPGLSHDGRTLVFAAGPGARPSLGFTDLWISKRTP